jgi:hypothetical protein
MAGVSGYDPARVAGKAANIFFLEWTVVCRRKDEKYLRKKKRPLHTILWISRVNI